ncbi:MAG: DMT family transporter [Rudaea sp.]|uniref:DMT family transporter n=1 Tax=Rudaea sp. TaxID=2136325 RepID=UPI0039E5917F
MSAAAMAGAAAYRTAFLKMLAGAALISTTSIFVRYAHVAPTVSAFYRLAFGGAMLAALLIVRGEWRAWNWRDAAWLVVPALAFAVDLTIWHRSIHYVGPGLATLIANFQVFVMALAGVVLHREKLGWRFASGLALSIFGLWLIVGRGWAALSDDYRLGVLFGVLSGIAYAVYMLTQRRAQLRRPALTPQRALCGVTLICAAMLAVSVVVEGQSFAIPDVQSWAALLALAFVGQVLGWVLISQAMPALPASLVGLLLLLQPALSFVLDVILFARPTAAADWIGLVLSLLGIFVASQRSRG